MSQEITARDVAARVLYRVDHEQAWASACLDAELGRARLDVRDAALAAQIVYGSLRVLPSLDAVVDPFLRRGPKGLDPFLRAVLRVAAYQLLHLSRVPPHAIVDAAVTHARRERGKGPSGFVNAVLRKVAAQRPKQPAPPDRLVLDAALSAALARSLDPERIARFLSSRPRPPTLDLRVTGGDDASAALSARILEAFPRAQIQPGSLLSSALRLRGVGDPRKLPGYAEGLFAVQEEGSQWVAAALGARPGERVLDACAGRGGKTLALAQAVGDSGRIVALDLYEPRLEQMQDERARLGIDEQIIECKAVDLTVGLGDVTGEFDRILVDAPCSGLGTIHRRPDILLRHRERGLKKLARTQGAILERVACCLAPGGRLIYAVCSPMREEGAAVVDGFAARHPELTRRALPLAPPPADADLVHRLGPWWAPAEADGTDAYQVFCFERVAAK
ncbi:MAG: class I SAM-dependent methyltransferase [Deltaproteobacteria bacterium]|nr:class I SAM-dependent methyltransferase [Deltaproteobacteria bacterium]